MNKSPFEGTRRKISPGDSAPVQLISPDAPEADVRAALIGVLDLCAPFKIRIKRPTFLTHCHGRLLAWDLNERGKLTALVESPVGSGEVRDLSCLHRQWLEDISESEGREKMPEYNLWKNILVETAGPGSVETELGNIVPATLRRHPLGLLVKDLNNWLYAVTDYSGPECISASNVNRLVESGALCPRPGALPDPCVPSAAKGKKEPAKRKKKPGNGEGKKVIAKKSHASGSEDKSAGESDQEVQIIVTKVRKISPRRVAVIASYPPGARLTEWRCNGDKGEMHFYFDF